MARRTPLYGMSAALGLLATQPLLQLQPLPAHAQLHSPQAPLPPLAQQQPPPPPPLPPRPPLTPLDSDAALAALLAEPLALVLVSRGHAPAAAAAALTAFREALAALGPAAPRAYLVDDAASAQVPALTFTETLGLSAPDPYVVAIEDFKRARRKYLMRGSGVPSAAGIAAFAARVAAGEEKPVLLGQARPPRDACAACPALVEVVSSSFEELVLAPRVPVLLLVHRRTCDACKAFAPRYRMLAQLAAQHLPGLRVAAVDAGDNDVDAAHVPESWTPVLRFFPPCAPGAGGGGGGSSSSNKPSVLLDTRVDGLATKIHLPTLPQVLEFLAQHAGGALPALTPAALAHAAALEEEAAALEVAYDQVLKYVQLWKAHSEVATSAEAVEASQALKARVLACYTYVVKEAAAGGVEGAWQRLDEIAAHVEVCGIAAAVAQAAERMQGEGTLEGGAA
jgi:hypothetical protein